MTDKPKYHKTRKFLKLPHLSGNREELKNFIRENLIYPAEAAEAKVQGDVIVKFKIRDTGEVFDPEIQKGIGYGCDEEAIRLVKMLRYDPVKNRGARVTATNKVKIPFRLPREKKSTPVNIVYTTTPKSKPGIGKSEKPDEQNKKKSYTYTITLTTGPAKG
ncbi:MAG: energy transducer TonB [Bacteroidota bacterium]